MIRAVALALLLAGCAAGGALPQPEANSAAAQTIAGADGRPLALSVWGPARPRAVILAVHGYGDYALSTFARAAAAWSDRGIRTYAYDQRGFGRNPSRGHWPGAEALVADLVAVARRLRATHPDRSLVVVAHSMGGGVALAAAPELDVDGLVLAAPAILGGAALSPIHRAAAWLSAAILPDRRISGRGLVRLRASDNDDALARLAGDPLYLAPPSPRELLGLVRIMDRAADAAPRTRLPALLLIGARDQVLPPEDVVQVFARLAGPRRAIRYEAGWHLLLRDRQAPRVWSDVADWVLRRGARARSRDRADQLARAGRLQIITSAPR